MQYKFCPKCAGTMEEFFEGTHQRIRCSKCGFVFYQNSKPTTATVIIRDRQILLAKRGENPAKGKWNIVGGFLEPGEHPEEGLRREIKEETSLEVEAVEFLGFFMDKYGSENYDTMNLAYIVSVKPGEPTAQDDVEELKWFSIDGLPEDYAFRNDQEILAAVVKHIKNGI